MRYLKNIQIKNILKNKFLISITSFFIIIEIVYLLMPFLLNSCGFQNFVKNKIKKSYDLVVDFENLKFKTYPDFSINIHSTKLNFSTLKNDELIYTENLNLKIKAIPFIFKTIIIEEFAAQNSTLNTIWHKNKKLGFKNAVFEKFMYSYMIKPNYQNSKIKLGNHIIKIVDEETSETTVYDATGLMVKIKRKNINLQTGAKIYFGEKISNLSLDVAFLYPFNIEKMSSKFKFNGHISDVDISKLHSFLPENLSQKIKKLSGELDIVFSASSKNGVNISCQTKDIEIIQKEKSNSVFAQGYSYFIFPLIINNENIVVNAGKIKNKDFEIKIDGLLRRGKLPFVSLNLIIPKAKAEAVYNLLPSNFAPKTHPKFISSLKKYVFFADVVGQLNISGNPQMPNIKGQLNFSNMFFQEKLKNIPAGKMTLYFENKLVNVKAQAHTSQDQFIEVAGYSNLYGNEYGQYKISTSNAFDLNYGQKILLPLSEIFGFNIGILPFLKLNGEAALQLECFGDLYEQNANGFFTFKNTTMSIEKLDAEIKKASGKILFKGKDFEFKTNQAYIDDKKISIRGISTLEGAMDYNVVADDVGGEKIFALLKNSHWLKEQSKILMPVEALSGKTSFNLNLKGVIKNITPEEINKNIHYTGSLRFNNAKAKISFFAPYIEQLYGKINFNNKNIDIDLHSDIENSQFFYVGAIRDNRLNINIYSKSILLSSLLKFLPKNDFPKFNISELKTKVSFNANYNGNVDSNIIEYDNLSLRTTILPNNKSSKLQAKSGFVSVEKGNIFIKNFMALIDNSPITIDGTIKNAFKKPVVNLKIKMPKFDFNALSSKEIRSLFPQNISQVIGFYKDYSGKAGADIVITNNKINGKIELAEVSFIQTQNNLPIVIHSGNILFKDNKVVLNAINAELESSPVFINMIISDIFTEPSFKGYLTTIFNDNLASSLINPYMTYPIRIKGDTSFSVDFIGNKTKLNFYPKIKLNKNSDISFMGANIDDTMDDREITASIIVSPYYIDIKSLTYSKYIQSGNNKSYTVPFFKSRIFLSKEKNKFLIKQFSLKTLHPTNAKIFNILFKKSAIKDGIFSCDLTFNAAKQTILGFLKFSDIEIPLYNTIIKEINIKTLKNIANLDANGKIYDSDFILTLKTKDLLKYPISVQNLNIQTASFNMNSILDTLSQVSLSSAPVLIQPDETVKNNLDVSFLTIEKGHLIADNVLFRELTAQGLESNFILKKDGLLEINKLNFTVADGKVESVASYNLKNGEIKIASEAKNVDANLITQALFNVKSLIYGNLSGKMSFKTKGNSDSERLKNTNGDFSFEINDGKMPKLGSLEYLLKATNLIKSGIFGLSINKIINLLLPINSGKFEKISGSMKMENGNAKEIQIFSKGTDLSVYVSGNYDIPAEDAKMEVWGKITNNKLSFLGPIGSASLNTFLKLIPFVDNDTTIISEEIKKIPEIKDSLNDYRIFHAKIDGNINSENYVSSFNWVDK